MKQKGQNILDTPETRDWILANYDQASVYRMAKFLGVREHSINAYISLIGADNVPSVVQARGLKRDPEYEAWLYSGYTNTKFCKLWSEHTVLEIAKLTGMTFPAVVYKAKKHKLKFSAAKRKEIAKKEAERKKKQLSCHVTIDGKRSESWGLNGSGCVTMPSIGGKCNGFYVK